MKSLARTHKFSEKEQFPCSEQVPGGRTPGLVANIAKEKLHSPDVIPGALGQGRASTSFPTASQQPTCLIPHSEKAPPRS